MTTSDIEVAQHFERPPREKPAHITVSILRRRNKRSLRALDNGTPTNYLRVLAPIAVTGLSGRQGAKQVSRDVLGFSRGYSLLWWVVISCAQICEFQAPQPTSDSGSISGVLLATWRLCHRERRRHTVSRDGCASLD